MARAWYRKYRPIKFAEVLGQDDTIKILKNALIHNTFVHAYLFSGPKGTGKTTMAKILAWTINCEQRIDGEICHKCQFCQLLISEQTLDILEIDGASHNGVEEIRNIQKNVNLLPVNLKYKIYIIDEIHMLTTAAFNALLKTLEEPPKHVIFIFATTEPYKVPATIISRCQWFTFAKLSINNMVNCFQKILTQEKVQYEVDALYEIAKISEGSLRDGINNLEKVKNYNLIINMVSVNQLFNKISSKLKQNFFSALLAQDMVNIYQVIDNFMLYESDFKRITVDLVLFLQDIIIYRLTNKASLLKSITRNEVKHYQVFSTEVLKIIFNNFVDLLCVSIDNRNFKSLFLANILKLIEQLKTINYVIEPAPFFNQEINSVASISKNQVNITSNQNDISAQAVLMPAEARNNKKDQKKEQENDVNIDTMKSAIITTTLLKDVINVLIQADKHVRKEVKNHWMQIETLVVNNKFRNYSKIFLNTKVTAACENAIIVVCDNITQANFINQQYSHQDYRLFLEFVLKKTYMIYALDKKQWKLVGEKFQMMTAANNLPLPQKIVIPKHDNISKSTKNETLAFLQEIFPEVEEI